MADEALPEYISAYPQQKCDTKEEVKREDRADILSLSPQTELENI